MMATQELTAGVERVAKALLVPTVILIFWQWVLVDVYTVLPTPAEVVQVISRYYRQPEFLGSLASSLRRVVIGYFIGISAGISFGIAMGLSRIVSELFDPIIEMFRPIAPIAWVPLAIIWFGLSERAAIFIIAYAVMFPLLVHTIAAIQGVNRIYVQAARTLGASRGMILREIVVPAALPGILTGLRIGMGLSWAVIVAAELTVGYTLRSGLGYIMIRYSQVIFDVPRVLAAIFAVGLLGYLSDLALRLLEGHLLRWRVGVRLR